MTDTRPSAWGALFGGGGYMNILRIVAAAVVGVAGTGVSLADFAAVVVAGAVALVVLYQIVHILPSVLREIVFVSIAVLCSIVASGWCLGHTDTCAAFSDTAVMRVVRLVNSTSALITHLGEELFMK